MLPVPFDGSYWVVPGKLLAGQYPGALLADGARRKLGRLIDCGVRHVINLMEPAEPDHCGKYAAPYADILGHLAAERGLDVTWERYAIRDLGTPPIERMVSILDAIDAAIGSGKPVYVHCRGGIGRTGTVIGCFLMRHRMAEKHTVLDSIRTLRRHEPIAYRDSPETEAQRKMVRNWRESRQGLNNITSF